MGYHSPAPRFDQNLNMEILCSHTFAAPIDDCWKMFHDPASHKAKFIAMGHRDLEILSCDETDISLRIVIDRLVDVEVPGFAKRIIKPTNTLRSTDEWRSNGDGTYSGKFELETKGVPIQIKGTTSLLPASGKKSASSTLYEVKIELSVNVPLIGGKIANFSKGIVTDQLEMEFRLGDEWLASH
ncbi:MAG: DUF2505 domain-containing protein [Microthrixaceae bacterium]